MKKKVHKYYYLEGIFLPSKEGKKHGTYDGHLQVNITWGGYGKKGTNPLCDEPMKLIAKELIKNNTQITLDLFMKKSISVDYIYKKESKEVFNEVIKLVEKYFKKH